ncbi:MAG: NfeD family protein [Terriglobales bacterium]
MEVLSGLSAFGIFLAIAAIGFVLLVVSLVFGEAFEHGDGHFDSDHDTGGPGFFSVRVMSVFITAFGGFGAVATRYGLSPLPASGVGFTSGLFFGLIIYGFARFLYSQQGPQSSMVAGDLVGQTGRVVVAIPAGGLGQVRCRFGEEIVDKIARSGDGAAIAENTAVVVKEVLGEVVVVNRQ